MLPETMARPVKNMTHRSFAELEDARRNPWNTPREKRFQQGIGVHATASWNWAFLTLMVGPDATSFTIESENQLERSVHHWFIIVTSLSLKPSIENPCCSSSAP